MAKLFLTSSDDVMALRLRGALSQRLSNKYFVAGLYGEGEYNDDDCIRVRKDSLMAIEVRLSKEGDGFQIRTGYEVGSYTLDLLFSVLAVPRLLLKSNLGRSAASKEPEAEVRAAMRDWWPALTEMA